MPDNVGEIFDECTDEKKDDETPIHRLLSIYGVPTYSVLDFYGIVQRISRSQTAMVDIHIFRTNCMERSAWRSGPRRV